MKLWDIKIYDTSRGGKNVAVVHNVPAETEADACAKVAAKKGYLWIGAPAAESGLGCCFAIQLDAYQDRHKYKIINDKRVLRTEAEFQAGLDRDIEVVKAGGAGDFQGLLQLYDAPTPEENAALLRLYGAAPTPEENFEE